LLWGKAFEVVTKESIGVIWTKSASQVLVHARVVENEVDFVLVLKLAVMPEGALDLLVDIALKVCV
jgi:hypothetical protein